jgi:Zn-dependent protease
VTSPLELLFTDPVRFAALLVALVASITVHEFSHAAVATAQGDQTARSAGRLTLNPVRHLDPFGTVFMVVAGFGWGRPVPFVPARLRSRRFGAAMVSLAGPLSNFAMAVLAALVFRFTGGALNPTAVTFVEVCFFINVILGVFNLIPIPPLDGSRLLAALLPPSRQGIVYFLDRYGIYLLLGLVLLPVLNPSLNWLEPIYTGVARLLAELVGLV